MPLERVLSVDTLLGDLTIDTTGACWTLVVTSKFGQTAGLTRWDPNAILSQCSPRCARWCRHFSYHEIRVIETIEG